MKKPTTDQVAAFQAADSVIWELSKAVCGTCESECWTLAATAQGLLGSDYWQTWLGYRSHMDDVAALQHVSGTTGVLAGKAFRRQLALAMAELQQPLFE